jgi:hypothetical protein
MLVSVGRPVLDLADGCRSAYEMAKAFFIARNQRLDIR